MNSKTQRFILSSLHPLRYPLVFRYYVRGEKQTKERERERNKEIRGETRIN